MGTKPKKEKKKDMATREELYRKFGPMLVDALTQIIKDEINILRIEAGLPPRTNAQLVNAIDSKLANMPLYSWMPHSE